MDFLIKNPAFIGLIGIVIGWALKEFSQTSREKQSRKRDLRKAQAVLIRLLGEMMRIERILKLVKDASPDWETHEKLRSRYTKRYGEQSEEFFSSVRSSIQTISAYSPWLSIQFETVLEKYLKVKTTDLSAFQKLGTAQYVIGLSVIEGVHTVSSSTLKSSIKKLSFLCGLTDFISTLWYLEFRQRKDTHTSDLDEWLKKELSEVLRKDEKPSSPSTKP